jgi:CDP-diacylglycerol--serine O-phosphatidyltransferase
MEKKIPNLLTLGNLFSGFAGIWAVANGDLVVAGYMVFLGALFDFFDGLAARLLKVSSPVGKELDSLCDVVTFGVLPAMIAQTLLIKSHADWLGYFFIADIPGFSFIAFLLVAAAAWRLARFNVEPGSYKHFQGMPSPAAAIFFASLPLIMQDNVFVNRFSFTVFTPDVLILNPYLLSAFILMLSWLMISHLPLFSLKISDLSWKRNKMMLIFVIVSALLFAFFLWAAIPVILFLYVILSYFNRPVPYEIQSRD